MTTTILWVSILVLLAFVALGFFVGYRRGLKRSAVHIAFLVVSFILAIFLTKTITNLILSIPITVDGEQLSISAYIAKLISSTFDLSQYSSLQTFLDKIPAAIISPILYIILVIVFFVVFEIIYLIFARLVFGKKKVDFKKNKPRRWWGAGIGAVEGFLFLFLLLAPLTSLTGVYASLVETPSQSVEVSMLEEEENSSTSNLQTTGELIAQYVPSDVTDAIVGFNNSAFGAICGVFGFDDAIYDYFSEVKIDDEKVVIRTEIESLITVYNDFVEVYNAVVNANFDFSNSSLDISALKTSLEIVLDNGLFRTVISDTLVTLVSTYDTQENSLSLPTILCDMIDCLKDEFEEEGFEAETYLKTNILQAVELVEEAINTNLIANFMNMEDTSLEGLLNFVSDNDDAIESVVSDALSIELVKTCFPALCSYASDYLTDFFEENYPDSAVTITLNSNISNTDTLAQSLVDCVKDLLAVNDQIDLFGLLDGDLTSAITFQTNVESVLTSLGSTFDRLRNLEIFVLTEDGNTTYVLDNMLEAMGVKILGDTVTKDGQKVTIETYSDFCEFLITPVQNAQKLGLFETYESNDEMTTAMIDALLDELSTDSTFLTDTIMPFYELSVLSLKESVFDTIKTTLTNYASSMIDIVDYDDEETYPDLTDAEKYSKWSAQFDELGEILAILNRGTVTVGEDDDQKTYTYIKYLLEADSFDYETLMNAMREGLYDEVDEVSDLNAILNKLFTSDLTQSLTLEIFGYIDSAVGDITGVAPKTFASKSAMESKLTSENASSVVSLIEDLLNLADTISGDNDLTVIGSILDKLKEEAYNAGTMDGVFNPIFANLIWYITTDPIDGTEYTIEQIANTYEYAALLKAYLEDQKNVSTASDYYTISYSETINEFTTYLSAYLATQG